MSKYFILGLVVLLLLPIAIIGFFVEKSNIQRRKVAERDSVKHTDGGYLADRTVVDCFEEKTYCYTGGRYNNEMIRYRLHVPGKTIPNKKYPLVVWLHGRGESGNDNARQLAHMQATMEFLDGKNELDFFVLATQCPKDNRHWSNSISPDGKGDAPLTILSDILDEVLQTYPVDRNRIGLVGVCSGGGGAWQLLASKPGYFSGMTVFSTSPPVRFDVERFDPKTPIWVFCNTDDKAVSAAENRALVKRINRNGGLAYLTEREHGGHDSWRMAMADDKVVGWLVLQDREGRSPPPGVVLHIRHNWKEPLLYFGLPLFLIGSVGVVRFRQWRSLKR